MIGSDNEYSISDGTGISDGRTIRRPSNRSVSLLLNQVGEDVMNEVDPNNVIENDEFALAIQGGACPQLVAPVLLSSAGSSASDEYALDIQGGAQLFRWEMKFSKIVNYGNLTFLMVALLKCICFYFELFINENKHCGDD